jgi:hypothetical protein
MRDAGGSLKVLADELANEADDTAGSAASLSDKKLRAEVAAIRAAIAGLVDDTPLALELSRQAEVSTDSPPWVQRFVNSAKIFGLAYNDGFDEIRRLRESAAEPNAEAEPLYDSVYRFSMLGLASLVEEPVRSARCFDIAKAPLVSTREMEMLGRRLSSLKRRARSPSTAGGCAYAPAVTPRASVCT